MNFVRVIYAPCNDREEEVKDTFWTELERTINYKDPGEKVSVMSDLNEWVGDRVGEGVTGGYRVRSTNDNGKRMHGMFASAGMTVANTCFKLNDVHKYT